MYAIALNHADSPNDDYAFALGGYLGTDHYSAVMDSRDAARFETIGEAVKLAQRLTNADYEAWASEGWPDDHGHLFVHYGWWLVSVSNAPSAMVVAA